MAFQKLTTSGTLGQIPIFGLLQELTQSRRNGVLTIYSGKHSGKIRFDHGRIINVALDGEGDLMPEEALREMLHWNDGSFDRFHLQWLYPPRHKPKLVEDADLQNQFVSPLRFRNRMNNPC